MKTRSLVPLLSILVVLGGSFSFLKGCADIGTSSEATDQAEKALEVHPLPPNDQVVKSIEMPHDEAEFPPGKGHDTFVSRCSVCHSLRYVTMQPDFPEATWSKEVDKMIKTFGAHITEPEAKEIVEYLMAIKGAKPAQGH